MTPDLKRKYISAFFAFVALHVAIFAMQDTSVAGTFLCILPPVVAIVLAMISHEVYSSLLFGCISGVALMEINTPISEFFPRAMEDLVGGNGSKIGLLDVLSDSWNMGIVVFLVVLGILADLLNRSGGRAAFTNFAAKRIKSRRGAQFVTFLLGCVFFIDDYFNCLTVGTIMRPITDEHKVSRAKLAYLVDSTASPICMIIPLSSWVAAVSGYVSTDKINGIDLFVAQIPYNYYCLLTILMVLLISVLNVDFGPMFRHEYNAQIKNDLFSTEERLYVESDIHSPEKKGSIWDLLIPFSALVALTLVSIVYTGGFFKGELSFDNFLNAFAESNAAKALAISSVLASVCTFVYLRLRHTLSLEESMKSIPSGVRHMAGPLTILILAWVFGSVIRYGLGTNDFFATLLSDADSFKKFLPAIIFLVSLFLAFAIGSSWGAISVLAPIAVSVFDYGTSPTLCVIALSAVCAGAVCGDHSSPISDTSIMASTGAHCSLMEHIVTQLPYVLVVVIVTFFSFILAGFVQNSMVCLFMSAMMLVAAFVVIKSLSNMRHFKEVAEIQEINDNLEENV